MEGIFKIQVIKQGSSIEFTVQCTVYVNELGLNAEHAVHCSNAAVRSA